MLKVPFVKWSPKWIFVARRVFSGIPMFLGNCHFQCKLKIIGQAKKGVFVHKNPILRPLYKRYSCHITILMWSWICQNSSRKCFFWRYIFLRSISHKFSCYCCSSTKVKDGSKMVSKVIFLDLMTFLMDISARQQKFWV